MSKTKKTFNNETYLCEEKKLLLKRASKFDKLYLEIGGHLLFDAHASRVLPGYNPKNKLKLIKDLGSKAGFVYCVNAQNLQKNDDWGDSNTKLEKLAFSEVKKLEKEGLCFLGFIISRFNDQKKAVEFAIKAGKNNYDSFFMNEIKGYPALTKTFSPNGFANVPFLKNNKKIVVVTGAGANSGKMFFCLSQIYHLDKEKKNAGYAKIETFPIWDLPLDHEVNLAYAAATADVGDRVLIDPFYKKHNGDEVVNYNRDIEAFPVLKKIITKIASKNNFMHTYFSPTDMGLNAVSKGIIDDKECRAAGRKEVIRRLNFFKKNKNFKAAKRVESILKKTN